MTRSDRAPEFTADLPTEVPWNFMGLEGEAGEWASARAVVVPVPYESTTSYGGGTRHGPRAILEASRQVEYYDGELESEPMRVGIHTLPGLELTREGAGPAMAELGEAYGRILDGLEGRFPIVLGGEHSISGPLIRAHAARAPEGRISVLQLDAHADLRDRYEGTPHSHASVMARVLDVADVVGVGIRSLAREEAELAASHPGVSLIHGHEMDREGAWMDRALDLLGDPVYLTVDVDYFDPSLVPATGTTEPGGGEWYPTLRFLRRLFEERRVVGCDLVELAPIPGHEASNFLVAKLAYKLVGYRFHPGS